MSHNNNNSRDNNDEGTDQRRKGFMKTSLTLDQGRPRYTSSKHDGSASIESLRSLFQGGNMAVSMGDKLDMSSSNETLKKIQKSVQYNTQFNDSTTRNPKSSFNNDSASNELIYQPTDVGNTRTYTALLSYATTALTPGLNNESLASVVDDLIVVIKNDALDTPENVENNIKKILQTITLSKTQINQDQYNRLYQLVGNLSDYNPAVLSERINKQGNEDGNDGFLSQYGKYSGTMDNYGTEMGQDGADDTNTAMNWVDIEASESSEDEHDEGDDDGSDDGDEGGDYFDRSERARLNTAGDDGDDDDLIDENRQFEQDGNYLDTVQEIEDGLEPLTLKGEQKTADGSISILNITPQWFTDYLKQHSEGGLISSAVGSGDEGRLTVLSQEIYDLLKRSTPLSVGGHPEITIDLLDDSLNSILDHQDTELVVKLIELRGYIVIGMELSQVLNAKDKKAKIVDFLKISKDLYLEPLKPLLLSYNIDPSQIFDDDRDVSNNKGEIGLLTDIADDNQHQLALRQDRHKARATTWKRQIQTLDLEQLQQQTVLNSKYLNQVVHLPANTEKVYRDSYIEIIVPAPQQKPNDAFNFIKYSDLPPRIQLFFPGIKQLNKVQSTLYHTALFTSNNMLVCAPTGAGKTNCAMLTIARELTSALADNRIETTQIVYIAPMKALVREVVSNLQSRFGEFNAWVKNEYDTYTTKLHLYNNGSKSTEIPPQRPSFSSRFAANGIQVQELSGDIQVSQDILNSSQILVSTPEKWDVLTRKSNLKSLYKNVKLVIIDEIHLLQDTRGPVLESIVARGLHYCGQFGHFIRFVGLSATLENYKDVAKFLRVPIGIQPTAPLSNQSAVSDTPILVEPNGLFYFDASYRPCPLQMNYVAVNKTTSGAYGGLNLPSVLARGGSNLSGWKFDTMLNTICYEKYIQYIADGPSLVFTHTRRDTILTAKFLLNNCQSHFISPDGTPINTNNDGENTGGIDVLTGIVLKKNPMNMSQDELASVLSRLDDPNLKLLIPYGFGAHHGGLSRGDREMIEDLYAQRKLHTLVTTATLAWGVNLPAHSVIIKGTNVYSAEKGGMVPVSTQDVIQMLGRAGRPQYDTYGDGIIISSSSDIERYISAVTAQAAIESQLIHKLPDLLNAEIVNGNVGSLQDALSWLSYTYFATRIVKNPAYYGVLEHYKTNSLVEISKKDPFLLNYQTTLIHSTLILLSQNNMIQYNLSTRFIEPKNDGILAAKYYISHETIKNYNLKLKPTMIQSDLLSLFANCSREFQYLSIRNDEKIELDQLYYQVPIVIAESLTDPSTKTNILLQSFVSRLPLKGMQIAADMVFISQSAGRLMSCIYELCVSKKYSQVALEALSLMISVQHRVWPAQCPLRQFIPPQFTIGKSGNSGAMANSKMSRLAIQHQQQLDPHGLLSPQQLDELSNNYNLLSSVSSSLENVDHDWQLLLNSSPDVIKPLTPFSRTYDFIHSLPHIYCNTRLQPISATQLRLLVTVSQDFQWIMTNNNNNKNSKVMQKVPDPCTIPFSTLHFTCHVYSSTNQNNALFIHNFTINKHQHRTNQDIAFEVPLLLTSHDPLPAAYYVHICSTQYLHCSALSAVPLYKVTLPAQFPPLTSLKQNEPPLPIVNVFRIHEFLQYFTKTYPGQVNLASLLAPLVVNFTKFLQYSLPEAFSATTRKESLKPHHNIVYAGSYDKDIYVQLLELAVQALIMMQLLETKLKLQSSQEAGNANTDLPQPGCMFIVLPTQQHVNNLCNHWSTTQLFSKFLLNPTTKQPLLTLYPLQCTDQLGVSTDLITISTWGNVIVGTIEQFMKISRQTALFVQFLQKKRLKSIIFSDIQLLGQNLNLFYSDSPDSSLELDQFNTNQLNKANNVSTMPVPAMPSLLPVGQATKQYEVLILRLLSLLKQLKLYDYTQIIAISTGPIANANDLAGYIGNCPVGVVSAEQGVVNNNVYSYNNNVSQYPRNITVIPTHPQHSNYFELLGEGGNGDDSKNNRNNDADDETKASASLLQQLFSSPLSSQVQNTFISYIQSTSLLQRVANGCATGQVMLYASNGDLAFVLGKFVAQMLTKYAKIIMTARYEKLQQFCVERKIKTEAGDYHNGVPTNNNDGMADGNAANPFDTSQGCNYNNILLQEYFAGKYRPYANHPGGDTETNVNGFENVLDEEEEYNLLTVLVHIDDNALNQALPHLSSVNLNLVVVGLAVVYPGMDTHELSVIFDLYRSGAITIIISTIDMSHSLPLALSSTLSIIIDSCHYNNATYQYEQIQSIHLQSLLRSADPRTALNRVAMMKYFQNNHDQSKQIEKIQHNFFFTPSSEVVVFSPTTSHVDIIRTSLTKPLCVESQLKLGSIVPYDEVNTSNAGSRASDNSDLLRSRSIRSRLGHISSPQLISAINAEVILKTISTNQGFLDYFGKTFLYKRLLSNPEFYNIDPPSKADSSMGFMSHISTLATSTFDALTNCSAIKKVLPPKNNTMDDTAGDDDDDDESMRLTFVSLRPGVLLSTYNIDHRTLKHFFTFLQKEQSDGTVLKIRDIILVLCSSFDITSSVTIPPQYHYGLRVIGEQFTIFREMEKFLAFSHDLESQQNGYNANEDADEMANESSSQSLLSQSSLSLILFLLHFMKSTLHQSQQDTLLPAVIQSQVGAIVAKSIHLSQLLFDIAISIRNTNLIKTTIALIRGLTHGVLPAAMYMENYQDVLLGRHQSKNNLSHHTPLYPAQSANTGNHTSLSLFPIPLYVEIFKLVNGAPGSTNDSMKSLLSPSPQITHKLGTIFTAVTNLLQIPYMTSMYALEIFKSFKVTGIGDVITLDNPGVVFSHQHALNPYTNNKPHALKAKQFLNLYPMLDEDDMNAIGSIKRQEGVVMVKVVASRYPSDEDEDEDDDDNKPQNPLKLPQNGYNLHRYKVRTGANCDDSLLGSGYKNGINFTRYEGWSLQIFALPPPNSPNNQPILQHVQRVSINDYVGTDDIMVSCSYQLDKNIYQVGAGDSSTKIPLEQYRIIVKLVCDGYLGAEVIWDEDNENEIKFKIV